MKVINSNNNTTNIHTPVNITTMLTICYILQFHCNKKKRKKNKNRGFVDYFVFSLVLMKTCFSDKLCRCKTAYYSYFYLFISLFHKNGINGFAYKPWNWIKQQFNGRQKCMPVGDVAGGCREKLAQLVLIHIVHKYSGKKLPPGKYNRF